MDKRQMLEGGLLIGAVIGAYLIASLLFGSSTLALLAVLGLSAVITWHSPQAGLIGLVLLTMIFERHFGLQPLIVGERVIKWYPVDWLLAIVAAIAVARGYVNSTILRTPIFRYLGAFLAATFVIGVLSLLIPSGRDGDLVISAVKNYVWYSLVFVLILCLGRTKPALRALDTAITAGGAIILLFFIYGLIAGHGIWTGYTPLSTSGTRFLSPVHAFYLLFAIASAIRSKHGLWLIPLWLLAIILSLARHLWIALAVAVFVALILYPAGRKRLWAMVNNKLAPLMLVALAGLVIWVIFQPTDSVGPIVERAKSIISPRDPAGVWRRAIWQESTRLIAHSPFTGVGFGRVIDFALPNGVATVDLRMLHNSILALAVQGGALLLLAFTFLIAKAVLDALRGGNSWLEIALLSSVVAAAFFGTYFETNFLMIFFWLALARVALKSDTRNLES